MQSLPGLVIAGYGPKNQPANEKAGKPANQVQDSISKSRKFSNKV